ncbi:MAG: hypothetical protein CFE44_10125 [Burkholderiales bacterium PBB4]|nr:MAG: hypothetical protein CFE44_10125 [Burkholderiales bacterium PBB4]
MSQLAPSLMQRALGDTWHKLHPALQAHYTAGASVDAGHLCIDYPRWIQPVLSVLRSMGVLMHRRARNAATLVEKTDDGARQVWRRTVRYPSGLVLRFNSHWVVTPQRHIIEFVNPVLGLEMAPWVDGDRLRYRGVRFVLQLGQWRIGIPEGLLLGHTTIDEVGLDDTHFAMDFRLTHPWFGQVFSYAGTFEALPAMQPDAP